MKGYEGRGRMFDKPTTRKIVNRVEEYLQGLSEELGVHITAGNARYSSTNITLKLEISVVDADGEAMTKEVMDFKTYAPVHGLSPDDLNAQFSYLGRKYKLIGYKPRRYKFPFVVECLDDGKQYKLPAIAVETALKREKETNGI